MAVGKPTTRINNIGGSTETLNHTGIDWWVTYLFINNDGYALVDGFKFAPNMIHSGFSVLGDKPMQFINGFSGQASPPTAQYKLDYIELS